VEVLLGPQAARAAQGRRDALARGPDGHGGLDGHRGAGPQAGADVGDDGVEDGPVGAGGGVHHERRDRDDEVRPLRHGAARVGGRAQAPGADVLGQELLEARLAGKRAPGRR
jgi:hypothetical protein